MKQALRLPVSVLAGTFFLLASTGAAGSAPKPEAEMWKVRVKSVVVDPGSSQPIVILEDKENGRILPIWIGPAEAQAIMLQLEGIRPPRPMTHDLLRNMMESLKAGVVRVIVTELRSGTFYAHIDVETSDRRFSIDSRPSDAIALALRTGSPIFVKSEVLGEDGAGISVPRLTHRKRLGIVLQTMSPALARFFGGGEKGVLVSQVSKGAPGDRAGLRRGDVILELEGKAVASVGRFEKMYAEYPGGFDVTVRRGKSRMPIHVRLVPEPGAGDRPKP